MQHLVPFNLTTRWQCLQTEAAQVWAWTGTTVDNEDVWGVKPLKGFCSCCSFIQPEWFFQALSSHFMFCLCFFDEFIYHSVTFDYKAASSVTSQEWKCITAGTEGFVRFFYGVLMRKSNECASGQSRPPPSMQAERSLLWEALNVCVTSAQLLTLSIHWVIVAYAFTLKELCFCSLQMVQRLTAQIQHFDL